MAIRPDYMPPNVLTPADIIPTFPVKFKETGAIGYVSQAMFDKATMEKVTEKDAAKAAPAAE